jgi:hypothetical protein
MPAIRHVTRLVTMVRPTQQGRFDVRGLPPADHLAIALPQGQTVRDGFVEGP